MTDGLQGRLVVEGRVVSWDSQGNPYLEEKPVLVVVNSVDVAVATMGAMMRNCPPPTKKRKRKKKTA